MEKERGREREEFISSLALHPTESGHLNSDLTPTAFWKVYSRTEADTYMTSASKGGKTIMVMLRFMSGRMGEGVDKYETFADITKVTARWRRAGPPIV